MCPTSQEKLLSAPMLIIAGPNVADVQHLLALVPKLVGGSRQNPKTRKINKKVYIKNKIYNKFYEF